MIYDTYIGDTAYVHLEKKQRLGVNDRRNGQNEMGNGI